MNMQDLIGIATTGTREEILWTPMPGLMVFGHRAPTEISACIYDPVVCLILQGEKELILGEQVYRVSAGQSLIVSHSIPVISRISHATADSPYLSLVFRIDLNLLHEVAFEIGQQEGDREPTGNALQMSEPDPDLIDVLGRYLALAEEAVASKIIGPLTFKEIHFRLLNAGHGAMLRQLMKKHDRAYQIAKAIAAIRSNFNVSLSMPELASSIGMSTSSFYDHFKTVTNYSPLQFQKMLRLTKAQCLLREQRLPVSTVAFDVGYESPTQFSREYSRQFGRSPRTELSLIET